MTDIRFLGQSCFELTDGSTRVLVDPFVAPNNPISPVTADELDDPTQILVSHGHADHLADAAGIAKRSGAPLAAIVELAHWFDALGIVGGWEPAQTYDRLERLFLAVSARLKEGWWASADGVPTQMQA